MGKKLKQWKWPLGVAGAAVLFVGVHTIKTSPEFAEAQASKQNGQQPSAETGDVRAGDSADDWFRQREQGPGQGQEMPSRGHRGSFGGRGIAPNENEGSASSSNRSSDGFRSSSRVS
ncbi:hypothetical protein [Paenibacillus kobensis]|uniref:hypothetical protein n=1 Tax=Paenibacillus kobensis TaxID=59841 RepID=UPI000FDAE673|nr:hypothetical protein [Paenibacillus kobensis]